VPKDQRFPFAADHSNRRFDGAFTTPRLGYLHNTALQNSALLLALSDGLVSDAEFDLQAK
jgi:hypothetical protein